MNPLKKLSTWRRSRRLRAAHRRAGPLREFVYLDEVSLSSLHASQVGPIATEVTNSEASSLLTEAALTGGVSAPLAKLETSSRFQASVTESQQVTRKVIAQSRFKEFYDFNRPKLKLRPPNGEDLHSITPAGLKKAADKQEPLIAVDSARLRRGDLVEVEVQLDAEAMFALGAALGAVVDIVADDKGILSTVQQSELDQFRPLTSILDRLLSGLVPLQGLADDLVVVRSEGAEFITRAGQLQEVDETRIQTRQLQVVGVAQQDLFWKDLRRVLFEKSRYRILGRVGRDGLHDSWVPAKLASVLSRFDPSFEASVNEMSRQLQHSMLVGQAQYPSRNAPTRVEQALGTFAAELSIQLQSPVNLDALREGGLFTAPAGTPLSIETLRDLTAPIVLAIGQGSPVDEKLVSDLRVRALLAQPEQPVFDPPQLEPTIGPRLLDIEVIAIYW